MLSRESLDAYRRRSVEVRSRIVMQMFRDGQQALLSGPPKIVERRFELLCRQNDERNRRILETLARSQRAPTE